MYNAMKMSERLRILAVGLLMGAAEVVPGVSGGTIAFVSGFYERLVDGIGRLTGTGPRELVRLGPVAWWRSLDLSFMLLLFGAMLVSVLSLARGVGYLLEYHPIPVWAFFFGLVAASIPVVGRKLLPLTPGIGFAFCSGLTLGLLIARLPPLDAEASPLALFLGGAVAVCAWILPGLSGSFVLLALGLYQTVIDALSDLDLALIACLGLGCMLGLLSFARLLAALLHRFHDGTIAVLVGFMAGSLARIWPWRYTTSYQLQPDGGRLPLVQEPALPWTWGPLTGSDPQLLPALMAAVLGAGIILLMEYFSRMAGRNGPLADEPDEPEQSRAGEQQQ